MDSNNNDYSGRKNFPSEKWKQVLYQVIFEAETKTGKLFDILLIWGIIISVAAAILESVSWIKASYHYELYILEWVFTIIFTIEYFLRLMAVKEPKHYAFSFFGIVDLLAIIPTYLSFVMPGSQYLIVIRSFRLLRVFRVLKMLRYLSEATVLMTALKRSREKITLFLSTVLIIVVIMASAMYLIEGPENGFTNIPTAMYWSIVTLTTVGYGDISPHTPLGKLIASAMMILGYGIIAVPTGIVSVELAHATRQHGKKICLNCQAEDHEYDSKFCRHCGSTV